jgi:1-acyl-sn-glycerol-3-phosphate acyltransferase
VNPPLRKAVALLRAARTALHLAYGLALALSYPWLYPSAQRRTQQRWCAELLQILNVHIDITADDSLYYLQPGILVTNHISWLDVFVLNAVVPMRFVAKSEVRRWPVIGWLCARTQTLFIERGKIRDAARINGQLVNLLQNGACFAVFPEGTTTDGKAVGAFHASLLQPAIDAGVQIHPVAIRYQDELGAHSTAAAYIDDLSLIDSMWNIFVCPSLHVHLVATPSLDTSGSDRRTLTHRARQQISASIETMHKATPGLQACQSSEQPAEESQQSLYGMLVFSPQAGQEAPTAID